MRKDDLAAYVELAFLSHTGITTLPKEPSILEQKLLLSLTSWNKEIQTPQDELYLFALEDTHSKKMIGVSAIQATTGGDDPLYFFLKEVYANPSSYPNVVKQIQLLTPVSYVRGPSEICSLFLHPDFRAHGLGKLLSLPRFLFMKEQPSRFTNSITAELRGVIENESSPFWEGVGRKFFNMNIHDALELLKFGRHFISHFLPKYPIYIDLLPQEVQAVIGKTHRHTQSALNMLLEQGFEITQEVDIFDGGPKLKVQKKDVKIIRESKKYRVGSLVDTISSGTHALLSNCSLHFRATISDVAIENETVTLSKEVADALHVQMGDPILLYQLPKKMEERYASIPTH
jgi:arginine N-succinyltransferase